MKSRSVLAEVCVGSRSILAHFRPSTGQLVSSDGSHVVEAIQAPDSWMALAAVNSRSGWGTRPTSADLLGFLERYVASHPRFNRTELEQEQWLPRRA